jgi:hypothetical protein
MARKPDRRGACSGCGYIFRLRRDGSVGVHHLYHGGERDREPCEGSGKQPKGFDPDWTLAPAAALRDWMEANGLTRGALARRCGRGEADVKAGLVIQDVLGREPLLESHAEMLERGTGIPARVWLRREHIYRADLAAGRKDTTPEDDASRGTAASRNRTAPTEHHIQPVSPRRPVSRSGASPQSESDTGNE